MSGMFLKHIKIDIYVCICKGSCRINFTCKIYTDGFFIYYRLVIDFKLIS